jgi:GNAT superfamily N-acetyltransferase
VLVALVLGAITLQQTRAIAKRQMAAEQARFEEAKRRETERERRENEQELRRRKELEEITTSVLADVAHQAGAIWVFRSLFEGWMKKPDPADIIKLQVNGPNPRFWSANEEAFQNLGAPAALLADLREFYRGVSETYQGVRLAIDSANREGRLSAPLDAATNRIAVDTHMSLLQTLAQGRQLIERVGTDEQKTRLRKLRHH